jgi:hypothetical protein
MRRAAATLIALFAALLPDALPAQTKQECLITINSDGSCDAAGLHVPCREIGPKLREAGVPANALIRFRGDGTRGDPTVSYDAVSAAIESVKHAGFTFKMGYINAQPES